MKGLWEPVCFRPVYFSSPVGVWVSVGIVGWGEDWEWQDLMEVGGLEAGEGHGFWAAAKEVILHPACAALWSILESIWCQQLIFFVRACVFSNPTKLTYVWFYLQIHLYLDHLWACVQIQKKPNETIPQEHYNKCLPLPRPHNPSFVWDICSTCQ